MSSITATLERPTLTIDLSTLWAASFGSPSTGKALTRIPRHDQRLVRRPNLAVMAELFRQETGALARLTTSKQGLVLSDGRKASLTNLPVRQKQARRVSLPKAKHAEILLATGTVSRAQRSASITDAGVQGVRLPAYYDRYITAGALKAFAGRQNELLLKKTGNEWEIVDDCDEIDLSDSTQTYRLGPMEIYS